MNPFQLPRSPLTIPKFLENLKPFQFAEPGALRQHAPQPTDPAQSNPPANAADILDPGTLPTPIIAPPATVVQEDLRYGDMSTQTIAFTGAGAQLVLQRPQGKRTFLVIVNELAAPNVARVDFDRPPNVSTGVPIAASANWLFDSVVPQNNVYVWVPAAGNITIAWINAAPVA